MERLKQIAQAIAKEALPTIWAVLYPLWHTAKIAMISPRVSAFCGGSFSQGLPETYTPTLRMHTMRKFLAVLADIFRMFLQIMGLPCPLEVFERFWKGLTYVLIFAGAE